MNDVAELLAVLAALYLYDCLHWTRRGILCVRSWWGATWAPALPSRVLGNVRAGAVWSHPLPPLGTLLVSSSWPLAVSADGLCTLEPCELQRGLRSEFHVRSKLWSDVHSLAREGRAVLVDGARWGEAATELDAQRFVHWLEELRGLEHTQRLPRIRAELDASLRSGRAREQSRSFELRARLLRGLCCGMCALLFIAFPLAADLLGLARAWPWLLGALLAFHAAILIEFTRVHGRRTAGYGSAMLQLALSPPQAARAIDLAAPNVLSGVHPLAVLELCPPEKRTAVARALCVDAWFAREVEAHHHPLAARCAAEYRAELRQAIERRLTSLELDLDELLAPPISDDAGRRSWCPRCELQFDADDAVCGDCSTRAVRRAAPTIG